MIGLPFAGRRFLCIVYGGLLFSSASAAEPESFTGKVTAITDGDSIKILHEKTEVTIRLEGIDCPELGQAFGRKAKQQTSELCFGKTVSVHTTGKDRYGRTLADVTLPDKTILNQQLVRSGYAWWFHKYSDDATLKGLEAEAKKNKLGLWADAKPVAPWEFRAAKRAKPVGQARDIEVVPNGIAIVALLPNPNGQDAGHEEVTISNSTTEEVDLEGWKLIDKAGNVYLLSGKLEASKSLVVTMTAATMPLNNDGDIVVMTDPEGVGRSRVSYRGSQAKSGNVVRFASE